MSSCIHLRAPRGYPLDIPRLKQAGKTVLAQQGKHGSSLTIVITDNDQVRALNHQHRQLDAPTDVLSFPAAPLPQGLQGGRDYLGDIVIAYPYTAANAEERQTDLDDVLCLLVIHACLHLLGYDHHSAQSRGKMWAAQAAALHSMRIQADIAAAYEGVADD